LIRLKRSRGGLCGISFCFNHRHKAYEQASRLSC
jgi:hypothetical protein